MKNFKYPLQTDNFSILDRIKVALFILNKNNRLTAGPKVEEFEEIWSNLSSNPFGKSNKVLATSSGSTANHLLVETFLQTNNYDPKYITVFCPSTTWASSVSPWIMRGCKVKFVDINLDDFSFNYNDLELAIIEDRKRNPFNEIVIWPTALIGFVPNIGKLNNLKYKYDTYLFADLCETTLGFYNEKNILSCFDMATTSTFWAHEVVSIEGGLLFINPELSNGHSYYENARMIRSHGLTRVLPWNSLTKKEIETEYSNIDKEFLFAKIGTNYRMTDLNAYFGILDSKRYYRYCKHRRKLWRYFLSKLSKRRFLSLNEDIIPFCLPIVINRENDLHSVDDYKKELNDKGWETRPIISFLPINPAYKKYAHQMDKFPNSEFLHKSGFYVGLNKDLKVKDIDKLLKVLNRD